MRPVVLLLFSVVFLSAACATPRAAEQPRQAVLLTQTAPTRPTCVPIDIPDPLPDPDQLVNVEALTDQLRELGDGEPLPSGYVLLTMGYEPDGLNIRRQVIEHNISHAVADTIQRLVFAERRQAPEKERPWSVRMRIDLADEIEFRVGRSEYCPPHPRDPALQREFYGIQATGVRYRGGQRERTVFVRVWVNTSGFITTGQVIQGAPTGGTFERDLVTHLRQYSFEPARVDGMATIGYIDVPVRVRG